MFYIWRYRIPPSIEPIEIEVITDSGMKDVLSMHDGPVLLNFYASWCGPCMREIPDLNNANAEGLFTVIGVTDDTQEIIKNTRNRFKVQYPLYKLDKPLKEYGVYTIPTTYLISAEGEILESYTDPRDWDSDTFLNKAKAQLSK